MGLPYNLELRLQSDKVQHFLVNFLVTFVGAILLTFLVDGVSAILISVLASIALSFGKEYHDFFVDGASKDACLTDILMDGLGVGVGLVLFVLVGGI